jgi:hypothetical protein
MGGGNWKIGKGLELAWDRSFTILQWAVFAATIGVTLQIIAERVGILGKMITRLIGLAWALAIYFIVPVLAFENLTPAAALKRSAQLFRKTWGENVVGCISIATFFSAAIMGGFGVWYVAIHALRPVGVPLIASIVILLIYAQVVVAIASATESIFKVALYNYAMSGRLHGGFSREDFEFAFVPKS